MRKVKDKSGRMSAQETLELWQQYKRTGDARIRDRLVLTFAPMVVPATVSYKRSLVKLPVAPANRPVPPVMVAVSSM